MQAFEMHHCAIFVGWVHLGSRLFWAWDAFHSPPGRPRLGLLAGCRPAWPGSARTARLGLQPAARQGAVHFTNILYLLGNIRCSFGTPRGGCTSAMRKSRRVRKVAKNCRQNGRQKSFGKKFSKHPPCGDVFAYLVPGRHRKKCATMALSNLVGLDSKVAPEMWLIGI